MTQSQEDHPAVMTARRVVAQTANYMHDEQQLIVVLVLHAPHPVRWEYSPLDG
jgi:hypothetical protein